MNKESMSPREIKLVIGALMSSLLLAALDQTIVTTALPTIVSDLGSASKLSWVITAYLLASTAVTPLYGKIGDLYGRKKILLVAVFIFLLGSFLCGLANGITMLIVARAIQGLGAGGLFPLVLASIADFVPFKERAKYQSGFGIVFGLSSVVGPLLGGFLTELISWRSVFYINLPVGAVAVYLISKHLHASEESKKHKIDYLGAGLIASCISAILLITVWGGKEYAWNSLVIVLLALYIVISLLIFIYVENKVEEPIIPLTLFKNKTINYSLTLSALTGLTLFGTLVYISIYLQVVKGFSPTLSGISLLPLTFGIYPSSTYVGKSVGRDGKFKKFLVAGSIIMSLSLLCLTQLNYDTSYIVVALILFAVGLGLGCLIQLPILIVTSVVNKSMIGVGSSTVTFFRSIGAAFGTALFGSLLNSRLAHYFNNIAGSQKMPEMDLNSFANIASLPESFKTPVLNAFTQAEGDVFLAGFTLSLFAIVVSIIIPNINLHLSSQEIKNQPLE